MPNNNTPSYFIPKQTQGAVPARVKQKKKFHIFSFVATVMLLGAVILAGFTFFYEGYTEQQLEDQKNALAEARNRFNEADIASVQELDRRMRAATYLLDRHVALSRVFDALELTTKQSIQFTGLKYEQRPSSDGTLTITGGTESFRTVALQANSFAGATLFADAIFTDLGTSPVDPEAVGPSHRVGFDVTADIPASAILYQGTILAPQEEAPLDAEEDALPATDDVATTTDTGVDTIQ